MALVLLGLTTLVAPRGVAAPELKRIAVQDFEGVTAPLKVWVVNMPDQNASVKLSSEHPYQGKQSLQLHYHFTGAGQYLGVPLPVKVLAPVHRLRWMVYGDSSGSGYGLYLQDVSGETHKYRNAAAMKVDWKGWKQIEVDLDAPHEHWGGNNNGKLDYPITGITFEVSHDGATPSEGDLFFDALSVDSEKGRLETLGGQVSVLTPPYGAEVKGKTQVTLSAPEFQRLTVTSWKPGGAKGSKATLATVVPDARGQGSFVLPADTLPHGPITVTITGESGEYKDRCYLQLYNKGGISWSEGLPGTPPAAQGMRLAFADDFAKPPSISGTDQKATYYSHKPPNGSQDFSTLPFSDLESPKNPFHQVDTYLRIRADEKRNSAGLLSSLKNDASGIKASVPCYFECRFLGPNAIGTWPAFWLLTDYMTERNQGKSESTQPVDEIDIIEAYGGEGPGSPNAFDLYMVTPHAWNQGEAGKAAETAAYKGLNNPISMKKLGIPSTWYEAFHTYGCKITESETIYYCDNLEVGRHKTLDASKRYPFFFLINLATGGGWPVDLSRYDGRADMYVDYVRVYAGK
jgi:hypothetical protein